MIYGKRSLFALLFLLLIGLDLPNLSGDLSKTEPAELMARYQALRSLELDGQRIAQVEEFTFKKDAASFDFKNGHLYFFAPVADKVTGAVFLGEGTFRLKPPTDLERKQLARFTEGQAEVVEPFKELLLIFTDNTFAELSQQLKFKSDSVPSKAAGILQSFRKKMREDWKDNFEARILSDLCFPELGMFMADIRGEKHGALRFTVDRQEHEEVELYNYKMHDFSDGWSSFHLEQNYKKDSRPQPEEKAIVDTTETRLDVVIERGDKLSAKAETEFTALVSGPRVLNLSLAPTLRVSHVKERNTP